MKNLLAGLALAIVSSTAQAEMDSIINLATNGRPINIEFVKADWHHIADYDNKEFWINIKNIEKYVDEKLNLRRVFAMLRVTDGDKKVPGIGEGVRRIYSEAVVNCADGAVIPVRDFYTDDLSVVVGIHTHPKGSYKTITRAKSSPGTPAWAAYRIACEDADPASIK